MKVFSKNFFAALVSLGFFGFMAGILALVLLVGYFSKDLPDYTTLANYQPPIVTRAYANDGRLLAEFATEKRVYVPIAVVPDLLKQAFISAEDKNFYQHPGVDISGIIRSIVVNLKNLGKGRRPVGASTITQQVARNFFLSNEVSYVRKIKEAVLAYRLEQAFSKEQILQLYLNEIYFGKRSYGVAAAALTYFDKPLDELSLAEMAYLAALPKAPNNYDPEKDYNAAIARRNWVIDRMVENGYVQSAEGDDAKLQPIKMRSRDSAQYVNFPYFAEEVRRKLLDLYGETGLYKGGLIAKTTMNPKYQEIAEKALRNGIVEYDKRQGLHSKPLASFDLSNAEFDWAEALRGVELPAGSVDWRAAVILKSGDRSATIGLPDGSKGVISYNKMKWAGAYNSVSDLLKVGDVWLTEPSGEKLEGKEVYWLRQIPKVQGALMAMDPNTGRVFAMAGGFSYEMSQFNRAIQAKRQPGSSFKPFVYLTAFENGFTPATLVMDAPLVLDQGPGLDKWRPKNYSEDFLGATPLRVGIEKSRNLMTIRLASYIGMDKVSATAKRFGIIDDMPPLLSMAVGAGETTLYRMLTAYSSFVNGGKRVTPTLIDRIQDREGKTIFVNDKLQCENCGPLIAWQGQPTPDIEDSKEQIADPRNMYQILSLLEGAVKRGTGMGISYIGRPVAGKTGTTNDAKDAWFIGMTPDIIVGVYIGFDEPISLGDKETGSRVALPIVREFMEKALKGVSPVPFRIPEGIRLVQINADLGTRAKPGDKNTILEAFLPDTEPGDEPTMFNGKEVAPVSDFTNASEGAETGLGGIY